MKISNYPRFFLILIPFMIFLSCKNKEKKPYATSPDIYVPDTDFKVVGYLGGSNFDAIEDIELDKLTYLNLAFGNPDKDGRILFDGNFDLKPIVEKGHAAGVKVFLSLAGGGKPDTTIWNSMLQPVNMPNFVKNLLDYVDANNLDGIDVDIEGNLLPYIGDGYTPFVLELRDALHAKGKGITCALGAVRFHDAVTQESLEAYDFINVMVYDKTGTWRPNIIGPHSPYSYAEDAVKFWTEEKHIPPDRIILGLPFYGFDFTPPARYISFKEVVKEDVMLAYQDSAGLKHYNGIPMIARKTDMARKNLGGVMIWELAYDTLNSDLSLLRALDQTIHAGDCEVTTFYQDEDGDGLGDPSRPFQACEAPEGYVDNRDDPDIN